MKLKFETFFRWYVIVLVVLLCWTIVAPLRSEAQTNTAAQTNAPAAKATNELNLLNLGGIEDAPWITFYLDRVEALQAPVFGRPLWQYLASMIYIFCAFYLSKFLDYVITHQLKRWASKTTSTLDDRLLELVRGPVKVISFVILLHIGLKVFTWPEWAEQFFSKGLLLVLAASITYMAVKLVDLVIGFWKDRTKHEEDQSFDEQLFPIIGKSLKAFVVVVAVLVTSQNLGLNITGMIASLSIGGLALGLAAQDTLANLFGAVAIFMDKPFRIGDRIRLDAVDGTVETIGLRSTRVRNQDGHLVTIPNKTMGNATITNVSRRPTIKTELNMGLTYDTSPEKVQEAVKILNDVYRASSMTKDVWISFNKFVDSALNIFIVHWWDGTDFHAYLDGMHQFNLEIKRRFGEAGIDFAFPTQTLYVRSPQAGNPAGGADAAALLGVQPPSSPQAPAEPTGGGPAKA